jgi:hypothetical protein
LIGLKKNAAGKNKTGSFFNAYKLSFILRKIALYLLDLFVQKVIYYKSKEIWLMMLIAIGAASR